MRPSCRHIFMLLWLAGFDLLLQNAAALVFVNPTTRSPSSLMTLMMLSSSGESSQQLPSDEAISNNNKNNNKSQPTGRSRRAFFTIVASATLAQTSWAECSCAADAVASDLIASQKSELLEEIKKDVKDDMKAVKDTDKLISTLKAASPPPPPPPQPKSSGGDFAPTISTQKSDLAKAMQLIDADTLGLIDQLELEEEQIAEETMKLMRKVETLEAASERLNKPLLDEPDAKTLEEAVAKSQAETYSFLDRLKKRSAEKDDLIKTLKYESTAFGSGGKIDLKLPDFVAKLRKTSEADREFDNALNAFRERLQKGMSK